MTVMSMHNCFLMFLTNTTGMTFLEVHNRSIQYVQA